MTDYQYPAALPVTTTGGVMTASGYTARDREARQ